MKCGGVWCEEEGNLIGSPPYNQLDNTVVLGLSIMLWLSYKYRIVHRINTQSTERGNTLAWLPSVTSAIQDRGDKGKDKEKG
jgi:hypothetical protein